PAAWRPRMFTDYPPELTPPPSAAARPVVYPHTPPADTRQVLIRSLAMLRTKHADLPSRKHGNPPQ
ncbi:methylmalonyl-CoA carboxyltransferase, partial [Streptomyces sp. NPDC057020]